MGKRQHQKSVSVQDWMHDQKMAAQQLYELAVTATTPSKKTQMAGPAGADGNYHIEDQSAYLRSIAFSRMMENNDPAVWSAVNRCVSAVNVGGMTPEPDTGDKDLNEHIQGKWRDYCENKDACDATGRWNYATQANVVFRRVMVDGDLFAVPEEDQSAPLHFEGHRCQTPTRSRLDRGICGVEIRDNKPFRYWLTKRNVPYRSLVRVGDATDVPAFNADGFPNVFHVYHPKMFSLWRGVSALGAVGTAAARRDDLEFATILKAQTANCVTFIEKVSDAEVYRMMIEQNSRPITDDEINADVGPTSFEEDAFGNEYTTADIHPGMVLRAKAGHEMSMQSPNIPGEGQLELNLLLLQYLAMCWDLPLVVLMLDARGANFTTFRAIMDIARDSFTNHQNWFGSAYHRPRFRNWLRLEAKTDSLIKKFVDVERRGNRAMLLRDSKLFRHHWNSPAWKYYHPVDDATGDLIQLANAMQSQDQYCRKRYGIPGSVLRDQIIDFNVETYRRILEAKAKLFDEFKERIPGLAINEHLLYPWPSLTNTSLNMVSDALTAAQSDAAAMTGGNQ